MIVLAMLILGLVATSLGSYLNLGFNFTIPFLGTQFHLGLAAIGLIVIVVAITAWMRFLINIFGPFIYTILIVMLSISGYWSLIFLGLGRQILPTLVSPTGSYNQGTGASPQGYGAGTTNSTSGGLPSWLPAWPNDPLGINTFVQTNGYWAVPLFYGVLAALTVIVVTVIIVNLRDDGFSWEDLEAEL